MTSPLISIAFGAPSARRAPLSETLCRWQLLISAAFAAGSLAAALFNLGALIALSLARFGLARVRPDRRWAHCRG